MKELTEIDRMEGEEWVSLLEFLKQNKNDKIIKKKIGNSVDFYIRENIITIIENKKEVADIKKIGNRPEIFVYPFAINEISKRKIISLAKILFLRLKHIWGNRT